MRASITTLIVLAVACGGDESPTPELVAVTFNTGTSPDLGHDSGPDDGYSQVEADISDMYYGNGLAWLPAVDATREFFAELQPDVVVFQEIFDPGECANIPAEFQTGFYCERYSDGGLTVAQEILGPGYQVACNFNRPDKCAAVRREFGSFRGCDGDLCLDGLDGATIDGCSSSGSRIGRGVIDRTDGGELTLVNIHGSSGLSPDDEACRVAQFEQVFVDLDGAPAASGEVNLVMGDLNTDPVRFAGFDDSARRFAELAGGGFTFISDVGEDAEPSYQGLANIDHVLSDRFTGGCTVPGLPDGGPPVVDALYFDHKPIVCELFGD